MFLEEMKPPSVAIVKMSMITISAINIKYWLKFAERRDKTSEKILGFAGSDFSSNMASLLNIPLQFP